MFKIFLFLHSINRWLVLIFLLYSIVFSIRGYFKTLRFEPKHNFFRHTTATILQIQLMLGLALYMMSPVVKFSFGPASSGELVSEHSFFKYVHIALMVISVIIVTVGSAKAKRMPEDKLKFSTILLWFGIGLAIILIAIPWPFSPLANRPLFRTF